MPLLVKTDKLVINSSNYYKLIKKNFYNQFFLKFQLVK